MTLVLPGIPNTIANLIQDRTLERVFRDALFPRMMFRAEARPELWQANLGERYFFTRVGLIPVTTRPLSPGADPVPKSYSTEQFAAEAKQFGDAVDTHMPSSYVTLASTFLRNTQQLGMNAAETLNRLVRDPLYSAYLAGETVVKTTGVISATSLAVANLNGFTEKVDANGRLSPVSSTNPIAVTFSTAEPANSVIGVVPDDVNEPQGSGLLLLSAGLTTAIAQRSGVFAATRTKRFRVGGGATVDGLTTSNILTVQDLINAKARLQTMSIPPHPDGSYHFHMSSTSEAQLFADNHFQRLFQSLPNSEPYQTGAIGSLLGINFYRNEVTPLEANVDPARIYANGGGAGGAKSAPDIGAEIYNANGVAINRPIMTGGGAIYEKYIDESQYITEAGVTGKIGEFSVTNNGVSIMTRRIRFILRAPLDRLQQMVSQAWSWSGDFPIPSDALTGDSSRYKRAIVLEHG